MKLGAQLYSVRSCMQTPEGIRNTFRKIAAMGYQSAEFFGGCSIAPEELLDISREFGLPVVHSYVVFERIIRDTDAVIAEQKKLGCAAVEVSYMPNEYHKTLAGTRKFLADLETPVKKIHDAGLGFSYHNHDFEFKQLTDTDEAVTAMDLLLEQGRDWQFMLDVCWAQFAGRDVLQLMDAIGRNRLRNVHLKDRKQETYIPEGKKTPRPIFAPCGTGILDFEPIVKKCLEMGVRNAFVEQDNAADMPDPFGEMEASFRNLRSILPRDNG